MSYGAVAVAVNDSGALLLILKDRRSGGIHTDKWARTGRVTDPVELKPVQIGVEAYISRDYARAERDRLWRKVWLPAGRVEEIPETGNFITYDIVDDSILLVRAGPDRINAFANVCSHRGRRLVDTPAGKAIATGKQPKFVCPFHAWTYDLHGHCTHIMEKADWCGALSDERTGLGEVKADMWGGWIWINLDPDCEPLRDYLEPAASMLDPFELGNMRYKWRKYMIADCNWKVALEAFNEAYHVSSTHPQVMQFSRFRGWGKPQGKHSYIGYDSPAGESQSRMRLGVGSDARIATAKMQNLTYDSMNAVTTKTLVDAANRLVDELPEGTPDARVFQHWIESAKRDDAARGVVWPEIDPADVAKSASGWQIFPNLLIGHAVNHTLCYSARPFGDDPDKCIFEAVALELFPTGEEPATEWKECEPTLEDFGPILIQDFSNMAAVQQGMKSAHFRGTLPNPYAEGAIISLHNNLARYMGTGAPVDIE
ncbi:MAG: aromatic ring-hydroxylating dioxygenase subunit alpha [Sphingomonadales bacterium]|nr:MAG: aromatic ring-hydroxylating dioxygenase subunit alpha [Sphingomonadales bacterium]